MTRDPARSVAAFAEDLGIAIKAAQHQAPYWTLRRRRSVQRKLCDRVVPLRGDPYRLRPVRDDHGARLHTLWKGHWRPDLASPIEVVALREDVAPLLVEWRRALEDLLPFAPREQRRVVLGLQDVDRRNAVPAV